MSEQVKAKKVNLADVPDLGEWGGGNVCRFFDDWNKEIACSTAYADENACAYAAHAFGARSYGWTGKACGS
jgi:hypothetical protein